MNTWNPDDPVEGIVCKKTIGRYFVNTGGRTLPCTLSARLFHSSGPAVNGGRSERRGGKGRSRNGGGRGSPAAESCEPVAVGDRVRIIDAQDGTGRIEEVLPRRNRLARRAPVPMPSAHANEQVIVANLDLVVPVFAAANPAPKWNLLDRYLVSAESLDLPALICITKLDLVREEDVEFGEVVSEYRRIGYPVILVSARTGQGLEALKKALSGRMAVFLGKSGVGKTSLLNALEPGLELPVKEVSRATGKGRHTTSHLEMFPLESGGAVVDTPGVREFGLWNVDEDDLALYFPEMRHLVGQCKFGLDCWHDEEPGCAVRQAVMDGYIHPRRYRSYLRLKVDG